MSSMSQSASILAAAILATGVSLPTKADDGNDYGNGNGNGYGSFGGNATLATDYRFRGISNSNEEPQVLVDFNWSHPAGFYAGVWSSNTDFGGPGNSMELDPYIGYANAIGDTAFSYDVGYWLYTYPGAESDFDYSELYAIGTWSGEQLSISPSVWYADDYFGEDYSGLAYEVTGAWQLPRDLEVSATVGEQTFGSDADEFDYVYYNAGITQTLGDWSLDVRWHDTDDVDSGFVDPDLAEGNLVFGVTRTF